MNFKICIVFLHLFVHFCIANPGICQNPSELARLHKVCLGLLGRSSGGIVKDAVNDCIRKPSVIADFHISVLDTSKILDSMVWVDEMSENEFIAAITAKLTFVQLVNIFEGVLIQTKSICGVEFDKRQKAKRKTVREYMLREQEQYSLTVVEIEELTAPLLGRAMYWEEFYRIMVRKK
ncbi:uncharacterized protein LOC126843158 [Adelges cooleyi]|uniref:uncharacterized protein LOC126843158 n=1 Tax=Adelges cooleyi TaxID=133065 RepID=UPI00217F3AC0|nr:uncharacterized protein LOC126843158 [Adelges cooleyi]